LLPGNTLPRTGRFSQLRGRHVAALHGRLTDMTHFDVASAAVAGALEAGARYADARVMHRRTESMQARNGEVEQVSQDEDAGVGVRALIGSSWGFYAVPDMSEKAARQAGAMATAIAEASASVPGPPGDLVPT